MAKVQFTGGGGTTSPSGISGSIQFNNAGAFGSDASNLFWDDTNNRLGIGTNTPTSTTHIKGNGGVNHLTSSFRVENVSNSASFTFRDDGSFVLLGNNIYRGANAPILSLRDEYHELFIGGSGFSNAGYITQTFCFSGSMSSTRLQGLQLENGITDLNATSGSYKAFDIIGSRFGSTLYGSFNPTSGTATFTHININTGINQTGTASGAVYGIDYNPIMTSILGSHYGVLIRPSTFNGFGLGATLPTANIHINHPSNNTFNLKIDRNNTPIFSIFNGGASNTHAFITYGGGAEVGRMGAEDGGGVLYYQLDGALGSTNIGSSAGIVFNTTGTGGGGNPSFMFRNSSTVGYATYAGVVKPALIRLQGTHGASSGGGEYAAIRIATTINQTGGTGINYGIIYEPTLTSIIGSHYGLVIRPSGTLNGIGHTTNLPTATWHVKGDNDSSGSSLKIESATYEIINAYNNRQVVIGGGSAATTTNLTINPGGVGAATTDFNLKVVGAGNDNLLYVSNGNGYTNGGVFIYRSANSNRAALTVGSTESGSGSFGVNSAGVVGFGSNYSPFGQFGGSLSFGMCGTAGTYGALFNLWADSSAGFIFQQTTYRTVPLIKLQGTYAEVNSTGDGGAMLGITPTYNYTGTGTRNIIGIEYNPTLTAMTGINYGLLIKSGLNGFGLGSTKPTATVTIAPSTTANAPLNIAAGTAPTTPNNGDIWTEGTDLKIRLGGTTYTITKTV